MRMQRARYRVWATLSFGLSSAAGCNALLQDSETPTVSAVDSGDEGALLGDAPADGSVDTPRDARSDSATVVDGKRSVAPEIDAGVPADALADASASDMVTSADAPADTVLDSTASDSGEGGNEWCQESAPSKILLFGGNGDHQGILGDTWEFDGGAWAQLAPTTSPPRRWSAGMVDSCSSAVMFGGSTTSVNPYLGDQWSWDGANWVESEVAPPARLDPSAAALSTSIVLFGGLRNEDEEPSPDTWIFQSGAWSMPQSAQSPAPSARMQAAMFKFESYVVLFGGSDGESALGDTWLWNGSSWSQLTPRNSPPARCAAAVAQFGSTAMLFGGLDSNANFLSDTWIWDGSNWTNVTPSDPGDSGQYSPSPRFLPMAAALDGQVFLFGGEGEGGPLGDTWAWNGTTWVQLAIPGPSARYGSTMTAY